MGHGEDEAGAAAVHGQIQVVRDEAGVGRRQGGPSGGGGPGPDGVRTPPVGRAGEGDPLRVVDGVDDRDGARGAGEAPEGEPHPANGEGHPKKAAAFFAKESA